jgi:cytochrome c peroxidase
VGSDDERAAWTRLTDSQRDLVNRVFANMGKAIAAYERTLTYGPSRFDQYAEAPTSGRSTHNLMTTRELRACRFSSIKGSAQRVTTVLC